MVHGITTETLELRRVLVGRKPTRSRSKKSRGQRLQSWRRVPIHDMKRAASPNEGAPFRSQWVTKAVTASSLQTMSLLSGVVRSSADQGLLPLGMWLAWLFLWMSRILPNTARVCR